MTKITVIAPTRIIFVATRTLLVAAGTLLLDTRTVAVPAGTLFVGTRTLPVADRMFPGGTKTIPVGTSMVPGPASMSPVGTRNALVGTKSFSMGRNLSPREARRKHARFVLLIVVYEDRGLAPAVRWAAGCRPP